MTSAAQPAPLRVLQVSAFFPAHGGGIEVVAGELAQRLAASHQPVHWMASDGGGEAPAGPHASALHITPAAAWDPLERRIGLPMPLWGPRSLCRLWRAVGACDVVHVHDFLYQPTLCAILFARLRGKPLLVTQHIGEVPLRSAGARRLLAFLNRTLGRWVLGSADQVVFIARPVQQYFERLVRFRRPPLLIANGVDHEQFSPGPRVANAAAARLLFVGRFVEKKGLLALRACLDLADAHWTFVGSGPLPPAEQPNERLDLPGRLGRAEVAQRFRDADLFVLPSTGEGFPLVVQEALACGTPVLVSREVAEAFPAIDRHCVFDVELRGVADAAAALRKRLQELLADRAQLAAAREAAVALARQWSWPACTQAYRDVYGALYDRRRPADSPGAGRA